MPYWRLFYHITWATREREPLIQVAFETRLHSVIAAKASDLGGVVHAVGGVEDHVHLAVSVPPRIALADFNGQVKGASSHFVNHELNLPHVFRWQAEYGIVSFGGRQLEIVMEYIRQQRQHHLEHTVIPFLERVGTEKKARG